MSLISKAFAPNSIFGRDNSHQRRRSPPLAGIHSYLSVVSIVYFVDNVFRVIRSRQNVLVLG